MHVTQYTDFGLRLLVYLAAHPEETPSVATIGAAYGISEHHLAVIAKRLVIDGIVAGKRGRGGGVRLARDPHTLRVGQLVMLLERTVDLVDCFDPREKSCPLTPACRLRTALLEARDAFFATLDRYTLADLVENRGQLVRLLREKPGKRRVSTAPA